MMVLVAYDVNTETPDGRRRLRHVAKHCLNRGQRVQNSVFECLLEPWQWVELKQKLLDTADLSKDSLRFYMLGKNWQKRVEHYGTKEAYNPEGPLII